MLACPYPSHTYVLIQAKPRLCAYPALEHTLAAYPSCALAYVPSEPNQTVFASQYVYRWEAPGFRMPLTQSVASGPSRGTIGMKHPAKRALRSVHCTSSHACVPISKPHIRAYLRLRAYTRPHLRARMRPVQTTRTLARLHQSLVDHRVGDFDEAGDVGAFHVVDGAVFIGSVLEAGGVDV